MDTTSTRPDLAALYRETRVRLVGLVGGLGPDELAAPVPACPGWSVADVVGHLAGVTEDAVAGRLAGPPDEATTAEEVARFRGRPIREVVGAWEELAPSFEEAIAASRVWPAVMDVAAHEQDIRGALGRPGARDTEVVRAGADRLLRGLRPPVPVLVRVEDGAYRLGPGAGDDPDPGARPSGGPALELATTRFEAFRWRLGRRSRAQLAGLAWSADPAAVLDHLVVFGPSEEDIVE